MISDETIKEFQDAVKDEYGLDLTFKEASDILLGLVNFYDLLAKIDHRDTAQIS